MRAEHTFWGIMNKRHTKIAKNNVITGKIFQKSAKEHFYFAGKPNNFVFHSNKFFSDKIKTERASSNGIGRPVTLQK